MNVMVSGQSKRVIFPKYHPKCFTTNLSKLPIIATEIFSKLEPEMSQMKQSLAREELAYYATGLLWIKLIEVKLRQGRQSLRGREKVFREVTYSSEWNIPEPIYLFLSQVGLIDDVRGQFDLMLPFLPATVVDGKGGYHAAQVSQFTNNLFEEVPSLGIAGDLVMALTAESQTSRPNFRIGLPEGCRFNSNLTGFIPRTKSVPIQIKQRLSHLGITTDGFPETIPGTRFCLKYMKTISHIVGKFKTFKNVTAVLSWKSINGGACQLINTKPIPGEDLLMKWTDGIVYATPSVFDQKEQIDAAFLFGFQLYKEQGEGIDITQQAERWCCVERDPKSTVTWNMTSDWWEFRNIRRIQPLLYNVYLCQGPRKRQQNILREKVQEMVQPNFKTD